VCRILVVDDEDAIREVTALALQAEGHEVCTAREGKAALELLESWTPELILLDLLMPTVNGAQFAQTYRERPGPHAPIVLFTAAQNAELAAAVAPDGTIEKPFELLQLLACVQQFLPASHPRSA